MTCRSCPHPPHLGICTRRNGGTAYACGCTAQTPATPDVTLRDVTLRGNSASLRAVLLHRPDAHPAWHTYLLGLIHLRPIAGYGAAVLEHPSATHELTIFALDPQSTPDPADISSLKPLLPPNLVYQLRGYTDERALSLFKAFSAALSERVLSPDTDWRRHQIAWLQRWDLAS